MKKLLALLLAMLLAATSLLLVACDDEVDGFEETSSTGSGAKDDFEVGIEINDDALGNIFESIFGSDFGEIYGSGLELPGEDF